MIIGVVRSGIVESRHPVTAAAEAFGRLLVPFGEEAIDRAFLLPSAAKPFQAAVGRHVGAALAPDEMAVAAGSHGERPTRFARPAVLGAGTSAGHLQALDGGS